MPPYQSPGVYVEEVAAGARPLEGAGTAIAAFIGLAEEGPFNAPTLVSNWTQFTTTFGGFVAGSYLAQSVYAYFQNGGGNAYVVRVGQRRRQRAGPAQRPRQGAGRQSECADRPVEGHRPGSGRRPRGRQRGGHRRRRRRRDRGHVPPGDQGQGRGGRGVRPGELRPGQAERGDDGQRRLQGRPARGHQQRRRRAPGQRRDHAGRTRRRPLPSPPPGSAPTTTSATSPSGPASAGWRRSRTSPCSACRT